MRAVRSSDRLMQQTGQGDAYVFSPLDNSGILRAISAQKNDEALQRKLNADKEAKRANDLAEYYKYKGPTILDQHYVPTIENQAKEYLDDVANSYTKGELTPEDRARLAQKKNSIEYQAQKLNALKKRMDSDIQGINQYPDYYDKDKLVKDRILKYHPAQDAYGNVDITGLNPDTFEENSASYIKQPELYKTLTKDIQKSIESGQYHFGDDIRGKETGSLFWKTDAKGNRVPGVSDSTIDFYLEHPDVASSANLTIDNQIAENAQKLKDLGDTRSIEEIQADLSKDKDVLVRDYVKNQLENVNEVSNKQTISPGRKSGGDSDTPAVLNPVNDVERLRNRRNPVDNSYSTEKGWVPREADLNPDKFKSVYLNPSDAINVDDAKTAGENKHAGNYKYTLTKIQLLPVSAKSGKIIHGDKTKVLNHNEQVVYKPFVEGTREVKDKRGHSSMVTEVFPYEQAKSYLDAQKVDLKKLGFIDPLGQTINKGTSSEKEKSTNDPLNLFE